MAAQEREIERLKRELEESNDVDDDQKEASE